MKFNFIEKKKIWFSISLSIILIGVIVYFVAGFNYGIDFSGGTMMQVKVGDKATTSEIKSFVDSKFNLNATVTLEGKNMDDAVILTTKSLVNDERTEIFKALKEKFTLEGDGPVRSDQFAPSIGNEQQSKAIQAILLAGIGMLIYIAVRFEIMFAVSAIIALLHDVLILLAVYLIFRFPLNAPFVAAVLTVVGYSINDTIVIFDRIRSEVKYSKTSNSTRIANQSLNQTLIRSINTSVTTILVLISLLVFGVTDIKLLALPLMVGVIAGTYSSIFIASPIWCMFRDLKYGKKAN